MIPHEWKKTNCLIKDLDDSFLKTQCENATEKLLTKFDIDTTCKFIKSYQTEYLAIKENEPELANHYTFELWTKRHCPDIKDSDEKSKDSEEASKDSEDSELPDNMSGHDAFAEWFHKTIKSVEDCEKEGLCFVDVIKDWCKKNNHEWTSQGVVNNNINVGCTRSGKYLYIKP